MTSSTSFWPEPGLQQIITGLLALTIGAEVWAIAHALSRFAH